MSWDVFWGSSNWEYLNKIGIAAALIGMVFSFLIWLNQRRKEHHDNALLYIKLRCNDPSVTITLQGQIRRKNLTRAEVLGLLGMLPMRVAGNRYELEVLNHSVFFDELERAQVDTLIHEVVIACTNAELQQFDPIKLNDVCDIEGDLSVLQNQ